MKTGIERAVDCFEGSPTRFAAEMDDGTSRQNVEHWLRAGRVPAEHCRRAAEIGNVDLWDLRPTDWHLIWPELTKAKGAPKPAQQAA